MTGTDKGKGVKRRQTILNGDCRAYLEAIDPGTFSACVTDPPYGLGFMGKKWDRGDGAQIAFDPSFWALVLRALKPGGHLLAFGGTRCAHRMVTAIEDAGFEIRDSIAWLYGSGFPKSVALDKAIDKLHGAEREVVGQRTDVATRIYDNGRGPRLPDSIAITAPATDDAKAWQGYGTALKPAHEPICVARKPLDGTIAATALRHGTAALNIDGCRVGADRQYSDGKGNAAPSRASSVTYNLRGSMRAEPNPIGRWPANVITDHEHGHGWFYVPKASTAERETGCDLLPAAAWSDGRTADADHPRLRGRRERKNSHVSVKPVDLMRYLVRLVTTPGDPVILDPFAGSGTTGVAAALEGVQFVGCEMDPAYAAIAQARVNAAVDGAWRVEGGKAIPTGNDPRQMAIFGGDDA